MHGGWQAEVGQIGIREQVDSWAAGHLDTCLMDGAQNRGARDALAYEESGTSFLSRVLFAFPPPPSALLSLNGSEIFEPPLFPEIF